MSEYLIKRYLLIFLMTEIISVANHKDTMTLTRHTKGKGSLSPLCLGGFFLFFLCLGGKKRR